ncbi:MAG: hypothetical protein KF691_14985 [Phycisphaeraceae bacterium]|nr:hypothetical protein [Phycisphaeraceae bacterium]
MALDEGVREEVATHVYHISDAPHPYLRRSSAVGERPGLLVLDCVTSFDANLVVRLFFLDESESPNQLTLVKITTLHAPGEGE